MDQLFENNVPYAGYGKVNLLRTFDMSTQDQANLIKNGLGDLLHHPSAQMLSSAIVKEKVDLDLEKYDHLKASSFSIRFLCYRTTIGNTVKVPSKFYAKFRFFTFDEVRTDYLCVMGPKAEDNSGLKLQSSTAYFLKRSQNRQGEVQEQPLSTAEDLVSINFEVDGSISNVENENMKFAQYLKERYLTIDLFDADSQFYFGSCKIPLFEFLRQGKGIVVRPKECEIFNADNGQYSGFLQVIISNLGRPQSVTEDGANSGDKINVIEFGKSRKHQPSQHKNKKIVTSKPMTTTDIEQAHKLFGSEALLNSNSFKQTSNTFKSVNHEKVIMDQMNKAAHQSIVDPEARKRMRIERIKAAGKNASGQNAKTTVLDDPSQPEWAKHQMLKEIEMIRQ